MLDETEELNRKMDILCMDALRLSYQIEDLIDIRGKPDLTDSVKKLDPTNREDKNYQYKYDDIELALDSLFKVQLYLKRAIGIDIISGNLNPNRE